MTIEPTDAEIIALNAGEIHFSESPTKYPEAGHGTQYHAGAPGVLSFARAVLARWGQPAHSGKPEAWLNPWRADQVTTDYDAYGEHGIPLVRQQPVVREPLTEAQINAAGKKMAECMDYPWAHMPEQGRAEMRKHAQAVIEAANSIKGGQHE